MKDLETSEMTIKLNSNFYVGSVTLHMRLRNYAQLDGVIQKTVEKILRNILAHILAQILENIPFKNQWTSADPTFASSISLTRPSSET